MLCFIFGAFRTVRTIAQFGSALDWGSRGRGFKSRWSDQESPSFRRFPRHRNGGFFVSRGGQGRCTTDLRLRGPMAGNLLTIRNKAPSGSVMPEGACRGRRTGHGAGKLDKTVLAALRGAGSGPSSPWVRAVALTPRVPLCVLEPFARRHALFLSAWRFVLRSIHDSSRSSVTPYMSRSIPRQM